MQDSHPKLALEILETTLCLWQNAGGSEWKILASTQTEANDLAQWVDTTLTAVGHFERTAEIWLPEKTVLIDQIPLGLATGRAARRKIRGQVANAMLETPENLRIELTHENTSSLTPFAVVSERTIKKYIDLSHQLGLEPFYFTINYYSDIFEGRPKFDIINVKSKSWPFEKIAASIVASFAIAAIGFAWVSSHSSPPVHPPVEQVAEVAAETPPPETVVVTDNAVSSDMTNTEQLATSATISDSQIIATEDLTESSKVADLQPEMNEESDSHISTISKTNEVAEMAVTPSSDGAENANDPTENNFGLTMPKPVTPERQTLGTLLNEQSRDENVEVALSPPSQTGALTETTRPKVVNAAQNGAPSFVVFSAPTLKPPLRPIPQADQTQPIVESANISQDKPDHQDKPDFLILSRPRIVPPLRNLPLPTPDQDVNLSEPSQDTGQVTRLNTSQGVAEAKALSATALPNLRPKPRPVAIVLPREPIAQHKSLLELADPNLSGLRAKPRPKGLKTASIEKPTAAEIDALVKEATEQPVSQATSMVSATRQAVANSSLPPRKPRNFAKLVVRRKAAARKAAAAIAASVQSSAATAKTANKTQGGTTRKTTSVKATKKAGIHKNKLSLVGVFGTASARRALVRLPGGRYKRVKTGERVGGWRVAAIGASSIRVVKGNKNEVLRMPK